MNTLSIIGRWFSRSIQTPSKYASIPSGSHPYDEEPIAPYDPFAGKHNSGYITQKSSADSVISESDMPAGQSILALYPDLTAADGFDSEKLGEFCGILFKKIILHGQHASLAMIVRMPVSIIS